MSLPYVVDAQTSLSPAELQVLQEQYESEASSGHITTQTKFNYAWALVKSQSRQQMLQGVTLLTGMWLGRGAGTEWLTWRAEIYRADPPRRRECLYYLALGHYKLSNYDEAKRFNGTWPARARAQLTCQACSSSASRTTCRRRASTR